MAELSAFAQKSLEAKNEKILKELSRVAANRKCVDCDNIGPQYVITSYGVFVCTACGGLHRQYGHRVKGISMSRFSKEEITALQDGGNEKFMATFCAKWTATALPRPTDRNPERTKAWIEEIYQNQKYYSSFANANVNGDGDEVETNTETPITQGSASVHQTGRSTPSAVVGSGDSTISNDDDIVHVLELTDLGAGMAKLQVGGPVVVSESISSSSSPSKQPAPKSPPVALPKLQMPMPLPGATAAAAVKTVSSPAMSLQASPRPAPVEAVAVPEPVDEPAVPVAAPTPSLMDAWDPFGEVEEPAVAPERPVVTTTPVPNGNGQHHVSGAAVAVSAAAVPIKVVEDASSDGWNAFADEVQTTAVPVQEEKSTESTTPAAFHELLSKPDPAPAAAAAVPTAPAAATSAAPGWAVDFGSQQPAAAASVPQQQHAPTPSPPHSVPVPSRREISLDTFYPEFEKIRATGVLPTGQPLLHAQMTQWGVSPYGQQQVQQQQHQQHATHQLGIVPPSPAAGGHNYMGALPSPGYAHLSPQQHQMHQQQFQPHQHHGMYTTAGTPTGSAYYPPPSPSYGQQQPTQPLQQQYISPGMQYQQQYQGMPSPLPSPATSVASVGRPASGVSTSSSQGKLAIDPFAHLAPTGVANQGQMQAKTMPIPPSPLPSGVPAAPAASAVGPGSQPQAASATLFGIGTSLTAYDLSAPAAPKPRANGNPFA